MEITVVQIMRNGDLTEFISAKFYPNLHDLLCLKVVFVNITTGLFYVIQCVSILVLFYSIHVACSKKVKHMSMEPYFVTIKYLKKWCHQACEDPGIPMK